MKTSIRIFSLATVMSVAFMSCGPGTKEAVKYNDHIMGLVNGLAAVHEGFLDQIDGHNLDSLHIIQQQFSKKSKNALDEARKIGSFSKSTEYGEAAVVYFSTLNSLVDNEGKKMMDIMSQDPDSLDDSDFDEIDVLATKFDDDYGRIFDSLQSVQKRFAEKWRFKIEQKK